MNTLVHKQKHYELVHYTTQLAAQITELCLYGAGQWGQVCAKFLMAQFPQIKLTFVDQNAHTLEKVLGFPVINPDIFYERNPSCPVVVAIASEQRNLFLTLLARHISMEQLFFFSAANPEHSLFSNETIFFTTLQSAREWTLGLYQTSCLLAYSHSEISHDFSARPVELCWFEKISSGYFALPNKKQEKPSPKLSVLIPVYQVEEYLERCIMSIVGQSYENLEIIMVNDGCDDNCHMICEYWAEKDSRISVIHQENKGIAYCRNLGMSMATGELIAFCDSDDYLHPETFPIAVAVLCSFSCDFVKFDFQITHETESFPAMGEFPVFTTSGEDMVLGSIASYYESVGIWGKVYRRNLLSGVFCPEGKKMEDHFFHNQILEKATNVATVPIPLYYYYYQRPTSYTKHGFPISRLEELEAGVSEIILVVGFMKEKYFYLEEKFKVTLVINNDFATTGNLISLSKAKEFLGNTFLCCGDHYFEENPFLEESDVSYRACTKQRGNEKGFFVKLSDSL